MTVHLRHCPSPYSLSGQSICGPENIPSSSRIGPSPETLVALRESLTSPWPSPQAWVQFWVVLPWQGSGHCGQIPHQWSTPFWTSKLDHCLETSACCLTPPGLPDTGVCLDHSHSWDRLCLLSPGPWIPNAFLRPSLAIGSSAHNIWHLRPPDPQGHMVMTMSSSPLALLIFRFNYNLLCLDLSTSSDLHVILIHCNWFLESSNHNSDIVEFTWYPCTLST